MASRIGENVPGWVERMLIPTTESRIRSIVKEGVAPLERVMDARFEALDEKFESGFETLGAKVDSLEKRLPVVQDLAEIKARLAQIEKSRR